MCIPKQKQIYRNDYRRVAFCSRSPHPVLPHAGKCGDPRLISLSHATLRRATAIGDAQVRARQPAGRHAYFGLAARAQKRVQLRYDSIHVVLPKA